MANFNEKGFVYVDASEVTSGLYDFANFTRGKIRKRLQESCKDLEDYMKRNAPWNDRSGDARRNLKAEYFEEGGALEDMPKTLGINLSHGVSYGVFLEYNGEFNRAYLSRRRPILVPTLEKEVPKVFERLQGLLNKLAW